MRVRLYNFLIFFVAMQHLALAQIDHWETIVFNNDTWKYFEGNSEPLLPGKMKDLMIAPGYRVQGE